MLIDLGHPGQSHLIKLSGTKRESRQPSEFTRVREGDADYKTIRSTLRSVNTKLGFCSYQGPSVVYVINRIQLLNRK